MKKRLLILVSVLILVLLLPGCVSSNGQEKLIRIHIRANSNSQYDQSIKLNVRDELNKEIKNIVGGELDYNKAYKLIQKNLDFLESIAIDTLKGKGVNYLAKVSLKNEYFPTREYGDLVVDSGYYDAVIVELGEAKGDNWWCVVYPPLCYIPEGTGSSVQYKSLIRELWEKYFGK